MTARTAGATLAPLAPADGCGSTGLAVSVAARLALPDHHPGVAYRPLAPRAPRRVGLAVRDMARLSPAAQAFVKVAREMYGGRRLRAA